MVILLQNEPPMVALWLPNAASESLEKNQYILAHPYPVNLSTGTDLTTRDSQAPAPKTTPKQTQLLAHSGPNVASGSLEKKTSTFWPIRTL